MFLTKTNIAKRIVNPFKYRVFSTKSFVYTKQDHDINCLMLHPVGWPNYGPVTELYLAEEAIGLVKSLNW